MARHFSPSPSPSPLPSSAKSPVNAAAAARGGGGLQWLFGKRGWNSRARHGRQPLAAAAAAQMGADYGGDVVDGEEMEGEEDFFFVSTPYLSTPSVGPSPRKRGEALARLRAAVLSVLARARRGRGGAAGSARVLTGTIFGRLRGRVHLALQTDPRATPAMMLELAGYSTGALVREMASGLVRLALECEKAPPHPGEKRRAALLEETTWRAYCNGRKCGYAVRGDCGAEEWRVLRAVEPVSVGAGVLPDGGGVGGEGDMMYMRARFERVVGSRDSEAFYMVSPDGNAGPELSIYLLRV
ncbi:protein MIZU-KUSSEI 1-like [Oryza brachyantha]|uniref:protein MIZU-KUSSEI 1-like n=1 Tax=Oryza brachyantha TaxID=4533 RepID=UPI001ADB455C|nr:protein MIZU-KUSSEI 1-like [Oryza brachyantha]